MVGRTCRGKLPVWWEGGLARGTSSVLVDWNRELPVWWMD